MTYYIQLISTRLYYAWVCYWVRNRVTSNFVHSLSGMMLFYDKSKTTLIVMDVRSKSCGGNNTKPCWPYHIVYGLALHNWTYMYTHTYDEITAIYRRAVFCGQKASTAWCAVEVSGGVAISQHCRLAKQDSYFGGQPSCLTPACGASTSTPFVFLFSRASACSWHSMVFLALWKAHSENKLQVIVWIP